MLSLKWSLRARGQSGGGAPRWHSPALQHIPGPACPILQGEGPREGPAHPWAHPGRQDSLHWILVLVPCATEERGPGPLAGPRPLAP